MTHVDWHSCSAIQVRTGIKMTRFGFVVGLLLLLSTGMARANFQAGMTAYNNRDYTKAVSLWETAGSKGDVNAQFNLGVLYEKGVEGYPKNMSAAYAWYRLAAAQGVAQAQQAIARLKPLLTSGQIEKGEAKAIDILGKWYRQNIGLAESEYQKILEARAAQEKAKREAKKQVVSSRAKRQRALIAKRDADAKNAKRLEEESRKAAIAAARAQAEEAKRQAYLRAKETEEADRLALLDEQNKKNIQRTAAEQRLAELKAKQQGKPAPTVIVAEPEPVKLAPAKKAPVVVSTLESSPKAAPSPQTTVPVTQAVPATQTVPVAKTTATSTISKQPAAPAIQKQAVSVVSPKQAVVASRPVEKVVATKTTLPVIANGMDSEIVSQILKQAQSVALDTAVAKSEIVAGRTQIEALKWSLISAARGKGSAKKMNTILMRTMSPVQIAESSRRAVDWIIRRQKRQ